jgi:hypothetical protein
LAPKITAEDERLTTDLPPELAKFASLLDAQPAPVRAMCNYCLVLLMVEAGKARLVETVPGENGPVRAGQAGRPATLHRG